MKKQLDRWAENVALLVNAFVWQVLNKNEELKQYIKPENTNRLFLYFQERRLTEWLSRAGCDFCQATELKL